MVPEDSPLVLNRRAMIGGAGGLALIGLSPLTASAAPEDLRAAVEERFGDRSIEEARVTLKAPPIAENGYSVPITVSVDSPMTEQDHIKSICILSERNPRPNIADFQMSPRTGRAEVSARIRLGGTQTLLAIAETNSGALYSGTAEIVVTLAACVVL